MLSKSKMREPKTFWALATVFSFLLITSNALAADLSKGESIVKNQCSACHKFEGSPESKFNLKGPDLMWGGNKYQRPWLLRWLQGKEELLYPNGYRWDSPSKGFKHPALSKVDSIAVADYFEAKLLDSRVKKNAIDLSEFTERESQFGAEIYKQFSCLGCHQIKEDGKTIGGPISANLFDSGNRYNVDWVYRFALNPQDFTPHSGEYLADLSGLGVRYLVGYLMTLGVDDYKYYEPWKSDAFKKSDAKNGAKVYKTYCTQCHGMEGKGDGPGAQGLDPKPAVHAEMALSDMPEDYLYNLLFYGGKSVGKSPNMPDWGLTIPTQDFADLIAFLRSNFKGEEAPKAEAVTKVASKGSGTCPQPRKTKSAPVSFQSKKNPLSDSDSHIAAGKALFMKKAKPLACMNCHGKNADGTGPLGKALKPKPRNFTCAPMMKDISDGQMFWIIKNGSAGTGMMAFKTLKDKEIWQLIKYIRNQSN